MRRDRRCPIAVHLSSMLDRLFFFFFCFPFFFHFFIIPLHSFRVPEPTVTLRSSFFTGYRVFFESNSFQWTLWMAWLKKKRNKRAEASRGWCNWNGRHRRMRFIKRATPDSIPAAAAAPDRNCLSQSGDPRPRGRPLGAAARKIAPFVDVDAMKKLGKTRAKTTNTHTHAHR